MNIKLNAAILILGMAIGAYLFSSFQPKQKPTVITVESVKTDIKYKTKIVTLPDGTKTETTEGESKSTTDKISKTEKNKYGVGLYHNKSIFGEVRLGNLPLFLIADTNFKEHKIGIKLEF